MAGSVPGLDPVDFVAQLRTAMGIAQTDPAPVFHFATALSSTASTDGEGVPFDATATVAHVEPPTVTVPCALTYTDAVGQPTNIGDIALPRLTVTLLGPDHDQVAGFTHVTVAGVDYRYSHTEPPQFLGSVSVWTVHCVSDGQP
ncbi:MAG: hypothetical protein ACXVYY_01435 [Oryzihumus sp.]